MGNLLVGSASRRAQHIQQGIACGVYVGVDPLQCLPSRLLISPPFLEYGVPVPLDHGGYMVFVVLNASRTLCSHGSGSFVGQMSCIFQHLARRGSVASIKKHANFTVAGCLEFGGWESSGKPFKTLHDLIRL